MVIVTNGLFTVYLDFLNQYTTGTPYWLELAVETNGAGSFTTLSPETGTYAHAVRHFRRRTRTSDGRVVNRNRFRPADLSGTYGNPLTLNNAGNVFDGNGAGLTGVNALDPSTDWGAANFWQLTGNAGTTPGVNFVGTPDNQPLEIHVDSIRVHAL